MFRRHATMLNNPEALKCVLAVIGDGLVLQLSNCSQIDHLAPSFHNISFFKNKLHFETPKKFP
jgi:hypothetical protein